MLGIIIVHLIFLNPQASSPLSYNNYQLGKVKANKCFLQTHVKLASDIFCISCSTAGLHNPVRSDESITIFSIHELKEEKECAISTTHRL